MRQLLNNNCSKNYNSITQTKGGIIMRCSNCGNQIKGDFNLCSRCGAMLCDNCKTQCDSNCSNCSNCIDN